MKIDFRSGWARVAVAVALTLMASSAVAQAQSEPRLEVEPVLTPSQRLAQTRQRAVDEILLAARSEDPFMRANAIEAAQRLGNRVQPLVQLALEDEQPVVRFAALATIGQLKLVNMAPSAEPLLEDSDVSVRMAAMFALFMCDHDIDLTPFASFLSSRDPTVRRNAVLLIGMAGEPSAAPMILDGMMQPMPRVDPVDIQLARIQAAEAIAKLTANTNNPRFMEYEEQALHALRSAVYSTELEVSVLSVLLLGRVGDRTMRPAIEMLLDEPTVELHLAAAEYMARTGQARGVDRVIEATRSELPTARAQAAMVLGHVRQDQTVDPLIALLDDAEEMVRLSAAAAIVTRTTSAAASR